MNDQLIIKVFSPEEVAKIMGNYLHEKLLLEEEYTITTLAAILDGHYVLRVEMAKVQKEIT